MSRKVGIVNDAVNGVLSNTVIDDVANEIEGWKQFVFKKDILNVSIGMIMATTFGRVVNSMVVDIITPLLIGFGTETNVENLFLILKHGNTYNVTYVTVEDAKEDNAVTLNYGIFINMITNLIFVSLCLYTVIRSYAYCNKTKK